MNKVYCKNCKFYYLSEKLCVGHACNYKENITILNKYNHTISSKSTSTIGHLGWNRYGDCKKYIKKWWKFWINI